MKSLVAIVLVFFSSLLLAGGQFVAPDIYILLNSADLAVVSPDNASLKEDEARVGVTNIHDDGNELFVSGKKGDSLIVIDTMTGVKRKINSSPVPYSPNAIYGTNKVYTTHHKHAVVD